MSFAISCPNCEKRLVVPDNLAGKRVKCKSCGEPIVARRKGDERENDDDDRADKDSNASRTPEKKAPRRDSNDADSRDDPVKSSKVRNRDDDEEDDETPPPKSRSRREKSSRSNSGASKRKKSKNGLLIGLILGGFALAMLLVCGGIIAFLATRETPEVKDGITKPPGLTTDDGKKKYSPQDFERQVMGKTPDQVIAAVGKADDTTSVQGQWYYLYCISNPNTKSTGHATLHFTDGKVTKVVFS
jgi:hypothetical protein